MNKLITPEEIREQLKQFDGFWPWQKISVTEQLHDREFDALDVDAFQEGVAFANAKIAEFFGVKHYEVRSLWTASKHDCDNFAGELVTFVNMWHAKKPDTTHQPAVFRIIVKRTSDVHAYNMAFTTSGIWFADLTEGTLVFSLKTHKPQIIGFG